MYKSFFSNNLLAYIEFLVLFVFLIFLWYKNIKKINAFYMNKFGIRIKIVILIITILLNGPIYIGLDIFNTNWIIAIAINAFMICLIIYLTISVFFGKSN